MSWGHILARRVGALVLAVVLGAAVAATAGARSDATKLIIFAGASLTEAFPAFDPNETYNFGGSNQLAAQIKQGAPADIFAAASPQYTQDLYRQGLVEKPVTFASNRLVLIVPKSNPAGLTSVYDLARKDVKLVIATPAVPVGSYTRTVLRKMGLSSVLSKVVSQEPDVKGVVGKVALGQADAGFVYFTDVKPVAADVTAIRIPAWAQPRVRYEIAIVASSRRKAAARAWITRLLSRVGQGALAKAGFGRP
jgi:molybdate transport system substrate-binding protein